MATKRAHARAAAGTRARLFVLLRHQSCVISVPPASRPPSHVRSLSRPPTARPQLAIGSARPQVFILGQCIPFLLTKARHFLVTWAGSSYVVRLLFYSAFTSHVEVGSTLACDTVVMVRG